MENRKVLKKIFNFQSLFPYFLIISLAVVARLIPHPANFAPIGGLALFSGAKFKNKIFWLIPVMAMIVSDFFLGFHATVPYVYFSFLLTSLVGSRLRTSRWYILLGASLASSILFFLITNFGVWATGSMYPRTFSGLTEAYVLGIPFFRNTVVSDLLYSFSFFYGYEYLAAFFRKNIVVGP